MMREVRLDRLGLVLVLASSAAFGANAIFAKLAYGDGATVGEFLSLRFTIAAIAFWIVLRPKVTMRDLVPGLLLGLAYCGQASLYFTAVSMQDASVTSVFQAVTPPIVAITAVLAGRERARPRVFAAIGVAGVGMVLVGLAGDGSGKVVPLGVLLAIGSSAWYAGYLLAGERIVKNVEPLVLGCLIATGGAVGFSAGSLALGQLRFEFGSEAWLWFALSALLSTVFAVTAVMAGIGRLGPSVGGLLTTFETPATILYAALVFGERLSPLQWVGAMLVLLAVVTVQLPSRRAATVSGR
jgi:drug/metabolite transporter (DMT)-like permease